MLRLLALVVFIGLSAAQMSALHAAERVALVIGNGKYEHATELPNPRNDAEALAATLGSLGFEVIQGIDLDRAGMETKIREFARSVRQAQLALFFYAGHGMQVNGRNFLIPIDAELADSTALDFEAIDADHVFRHMGAEDRVALAFLDACRNNPLARRFARTLGPTRSATVGQGLATPSSAGSGLFIAFATAPDDVALDGDGHNSPFTQALLKHLPSPGLEIQQVMTRVKADVWEATAGDQQPWHSSDLRSEVYLLPMQTVDAEPGQDDPAAADFMIARQMNSKGAWEAFLARHGDQESFYVQLAEAALQQLALGIFPPEPQRPDPQRQAAEAAEAIRQCDELAADPDDAARPAGVKGVEFENIDAAQAIASCEKARAAEPDNLRLIFQLGRALQKAKRHEEAAAMFRKAAEGEHTKAMSGLGFLYAKGRGVEQDHLEARRWYEGAAALGDALGMNLLGVLYQNGEGVERDYHEARRWYEGAAALGDATGMGNLAWLYHEGLGVEQDYREARRWYEKAAALGYVLGMNNLAWIYRDGIGVKQDRREARRWYEKAIALRDSTAMYNLAMMLQLGWGGPVDMTRSSELYIASLELRNGHTIAELKGNPGWFHVDVRRAAQRLLIEKGHLKGRADGVIGPATRAALDAYFESQ